MSETQEPNPKKIPVVHELLGVFQEVPGLPSNREIKYMIELAPSITPISKLTYWMTPAKLALQEK